MGYTGQIRPKTEFDIFAYSFKVEFNRNQFRDFINNTYGHEFSIGKQVHFVESTTTRKGRPSLQTGDFSSREWSVACIRTTMQHIGNSMMISSAWMRKGTEFIDLRVKYRDDPECVKKNKMAMVQASPITTKRILKHIQLLVFTKSHFNPLRFKG